MKRWPVKHCPGRFLLYTSDIIGHLLGAVNRTPFLWLDDVYVTGLLAAKVGHQGRIQDFLKGGSNEEKGGSSA